MSVCNRVVTEVREWHDYKHLLLKFTVSVCYSN